MRNGGVAAYAGKGETVSHGKRKRIALVMGLADTYEHGIARGVVRYAKERHTWDLYGYGWMFPALRCTGLLAR